MIALIFDNNYRNAFIKDRVSSGGNAITSVRLSVHLFPLYLSNRLIFGLDLLHVCGSLPWPAGIETEGHRSSKVK